MDLVKDPISGLMVPKKLVDEKLALKKVIDEFVDMAVKDNQHRKNNYYLVFHAKFDYDGTFVIDAPLITEKLPPFTSNQMVFWVSNSKGICELLWMVAPIKKGKKLKVEFNTTGVAYLQAKSAMPKSIPA